MTWIIASIPLWIAGIGMLIVAIGALGHVIYRAKDMKQEKFDGLVCGSILLLMMAGASLFVAAKIAS